MRILLLFLLIFSFSNSVLATSVDDANNQMKPIRLDTTNENVNVNLNNSSLLEYDDIKITGKDKLDKNRYYNQNENAKSSMSFSKSKKLGNTTFGSRYTGNTTADSYSQSASLFSEYQRGKFSVDTAYKSSNLRNFGQKNTGTVSFSPQYRLNDYFTLKNVYSSDLSKNNRKGEVVFSITPIKNDRDRWDLNVGAGQTFDDNNGLSRSQLNFSTKFRF